MLCVYVATDRHGLDGNHDGKLLFGTARMIPHYCISLTMKRPFKRMHVYSMQPMLDTFNKAGTFGYAYALLPLLTCRRSRVGQQKKEKGWSLITGSCPNSLWQECSETYNNGIQWHTMARWQVNMVYGELIGKLSTVWWRTSHICPLPGLHKVRLQSFRPQAGFWLNLIPKGLRFG